MTMTLTNLCTGFDALNESERISICNIRCKFEMIYTCILNTAFMILGTVVYAKRIDATCNVGYVVASEIVTIYYFHFLNPHTRKIKGRHFPCLVPFSMVLIKITTTTSSRTIRP